MSESPRKTTRRTFLAAVGAGGGALLSGGCVSLLRGGRSARSTHANGRLSVGVIGAGGRGAVNLAAVCESDVTVAALCDVDEAALLAGREKAARQSPGVRLYKDFRVMFEAEKALDAVIISTPDHGHGLQASWALEKGCHVYVETPLARTLGEARHLRDQARACGAVLQTGDALSATEEYRRATEIVTSGLLGTVTEAHVWTSRPVWPQGVGRPEGSDPVPPALDWDLWLGGAPARPFKSKVYHRFNWRGWTDFGTGALGDAGCQTLGFVFRALRLEAPAAVEATEISGRQPETYPKFSEVRFEFAARGKRQPPVSLQWYDGGRRPADEVMPQVLAAYGQMPSSGCVLIGEKGLWLMADETGTRHALALRDEARVWDFEKHEACRAVPRTLPQPRVTSHVAEFFDVIRNGGKPFSGLDVAAPLTECVLAGCVAQRVPGRLEWNSRKGRFARQPAADLLVTPEFRAGWGYLKS